VARSAAEIERPRDAARCGALEEGARRGLEVVREASEAIRGALRVAEAVAAICPS
jgi:hypothetical protein